MIDILLLGGAPGSGKSTAARALSDHAAVIEVDDLRGELWRLPAAAALSPREMYHLALGQAATMALAFLQRGERQVVVVDTFGLEAFHLFFSALRGRARTASVSLVVGFAEHAHRLETRPEVPGVFRDLEAARRLDEELHRNLMTKRIDTTHLAPAEVVSMLVAALCRTHAPNLPVSTERPT